MTPHLGTAEFDFRQLVEAITDYAIFLLDDDGMIRTWSPGAQRIKGWSAEEVIGQHFSMFYGPDDLAARKPWRELELALANGRFEDEGWRLRRDGSSFWADIIITPLYSQDGRHYGFAKITRDLTERKHVEDAARHLALLDQREAIGAEILAKTMSSLFRVGMGLQALMFRTDDGVMKDGLEASIDELDALIGEVRAALFRPKQPMEQSERKATD